MTEFDFDNAPISRRDPFSLRQDLMAAWKLIVSIIVGLGVVSVVLLAVFWLGIIPFATMYWDKHSNTFGDTFGFVNAIFSGLAFAGVIVTLWMQREELRLQRQELKETREELRRSADAQAFSEKRLESPSKPVGC